MLFKTSLVLHNEWPFFPSAYTGGGLLSNEIHLIANRTQDQDCGFELLCSQCKGTAAWLFFNGVQLGVLCTFSFLILLLI